MEAFSLEEAQNRLDDLIQDALQGKAVYIQLNDKQSFNLYRYPQSVKREKWEAPEI
jgi:hypothetical protein